MYVKVLHLIMIVMLSIKTFVLSLHCKTKITGYERKKHIQRI